MMNKKIIAGLVILVFLFPGVLAANNFRSLKCGRYKAAGKLEKKNSRYFFTLFPAPAGSKEIPRSIRRLEVIKSALDEADYIAYEDMYLTADIELHSFSEEKSQVTLHSIMGPAGPAEIYDFKKYITPIKLFKCREPKDIVFGKKKKPGK